MKSVGLLALRGPSTEIDPQEPLKSQLDHDRRRTVSTFRTHHTPVGASRKRLQPEGLAMTNNPTLFDDSEDQTRNVHPTARTGHAPAYYAAGGAGQTSDIETWATPCAFFDRLNQHHEFVLDSCALADSSLVPGNWYGPDHPDETRRDSFTRNWAVDAHERPVWMNPPYGRSIGKWMNKAVETARAGSTVVCLVPARTGARWFANTAFQHGHVMFVQGRLKFGNAASGAPFDSAVVIFDRNRVKKDSKMTLTRSEKGVRVDAHLIAR